MMDFKTIGDFFNNLVTNSLGKFIVAVIILLVGFIVGKILGKLLEKILHELEINKLFRRWFKTEANFEEIFGLILSYVIYIFAIIMALNQIGLTATILNFLAAAILVIIIISVFLSLKDFLPNLFAGFGLLKGGKIKEGDRIKIKDIEGKITRINLTEVEIDSKGDILHIPNSLFVKNEYLIKRSK
jgi:small-conductance mechanosensitive channel